MNYLQKTMLKHVVVTIAGVLIMPVFLGGCVATTLMTVNAVDTAGKPLTEATVAVDGQTIGKTPKAQTLVLNWNYKDTEIKVTKDGYRPATVYADKELKVANLVITFINFTAAFWIMGPEPKQTVVMKQALPGLPSEFVQSIVTIANQVADALEYDAKAASDNGFTLSGEYSKLFYKLAEDAGYDVYYITAGNHIYNAIFFEEEWYFFDSIDYDSHRNINWLLKFDWYNSYRLEAHKLDKNGGGTTRAAGTFKINPSGIPEFTQGEYK